MWRRVVWQKFDSVILFDLLKRHKLCDYLRRWKSRYQEAMKSFYGLWLWHYSVDWHRIWALARRCYKGTAAQSGEMISNCRLFRCQQFPREFNVNCILHNLEFRRSGPLQNMRLGSLCCIARLTYDRTISLLPNGDAIGGRGTSSAPRV
jgi:hypothetical protein